MAILFLDNYYGMMNSWKYISTHKKIFEHNILASVLAAISKICALILCYAASRKCLPLMMLQFFTSICYFVLSFYQFDPTDSPDFGLGVNFVVHMSTFLITASFGLVWVITPETFPKKYRWVYYRTSFKKLMMLVHKSDFTLAN